MFDAPGSRHIHRHPTRSYMLWRSWEASLSCYAWPSLIRALATPASEKEGFPETRHRCFFNVFSKQSPTSSKTNEGCVCKLLSRRRHISLSRVAIVKRHKSGISLPDSTTSDSDVMPKYKVNNAKSSVINAGGIIDIGP